MCPCTRRLKSLDIRKFMSMSISARRKHGAHTFQAKFIQAYDKVYQFASRPAGAILVAKIFFESSCFRLHLGTLNGPNGFLAFLVPRLGPKNLKTN